MKILLIVLCAWLSVAAQSESFEKQALSTVQQVPASSLDARLPNRPFVAWLTGLVGKEAGVVWQLGECGSVAPAQDTPACAEVITRLPNGDTVIVGISVGTFNQRLIKEPSFHGALVKSGERFYRVHQLSDLPVMLRSPGGVPPVLPDLNPSPLLIDMPPPTTYPILASLGPDIENSGSEILASDEKPPPPPPRRSPRISGELVEATVIKKSKPIYPASARTMRVSGTVEVRVVISESGRVIEAAAISGHVALRAAAEDAARQWVYKPATRDGVPVATESVLSFTFNPIGQ
jgi:TonB family protein